MAVLPAKLERDSWGIDTLEKAFIWSALSLQRIARKSTVEEYRDYIRYGHRILNKKQGNIYPIFIAEVKLPFNSDIFLVNGGRISVALQEFSDSAVIPPMIFTLSSEPEDVLEPAWVTTLEKYCLWAFQSLLKAALDNESESLDYEISDEPGQKAYVKCTARIPIRYSIVLSELSYVDALGQTESEWNTLIGNQFLVDNNSLLKN